MTTTVQKWGNSQGVRISKAMLDAVQWRDDELVTLRVDKDRIVIERAVPRKTIVELFEDYDGDYTPSEIDWGKPMGNEVW